MFVENNNNQKFLEWYFIFLVENLEFVYGNWEDKIIWDVEVLYNCCIY